MMQRGFPVISTLPSMLDDGATAAAAHNEDSASIDMLDIVGSERCLEMLHVLNEVFDALECPEGAEFEAPACRTF